MAFRSMMRSVTFLTVMTLGAAASAHAQATDTIRSVPPVPPTGWSAPGLHLTLSAGFAALQTLDVVTTLRGVRNGSAVEANPLVGGLAERPAALIAVKGGLTAATLLSMNSLARKHPKAAALTMIALNAGTAFVVRSNFKIAVTR